MDESTIIVRSGEERKITKGQVAHVLRGGRVFAEDATIHIHPGARITTVRCRLYMHKVSGHSIDSGETGYILPGSSAHGRPGSILHVFKGANITSVGATIYFYEGVHHLWIDPNETGHALPGSYVQARRNSTLYVYPGSGWDSSGYVIDLQELPEEMVTNLAEIIAEGEAVNPPILKRRLRWIKHWPFVSLG